MGKAGEGAPALALPVVDASRGTRRSAPDQAASVTGEPRKRSKSPTGSGLLTQ